MKGKYLNRFAGELLKERLEARGAVLVQGPKWCGKSTTSVQIAKTIIYMQDPKTKEQNINLAKADSHYFLQGKTPLMIDEWQIIPFIWDAIRFEVDQRDEFGQFILTGSVTPVSTDDITHSGIGRISKLTMRPMTLFESLDSTGEVSLKKLFDGEKNINGKSEKSLQDLAFLLCRGGWPKSVGQRKNIALLQAQSYYEELLETDFKKVDGISRSRGRLELLLRSYARNISTQANLTTLKDDVKANDADSIDEDTIASYISALEKLFVIENLEAWNPNLRSKTAIRTSNTRHFVDPSVGTAALGIAPDDLMNDLNTYGLLFEDMCVRDLRVYADTIGGRVFHYRDKSGLEADAVIHLRNGSYGLVEVKLFSDDNIDEGAANLLKLRDKIDTTKMKEPSFMMVITGGPYAYRREDGVLVVPLACLTA